MTCIWNFALVISLNLNPQLIDLNISSTFPFSVQSVEESFENGERSVIWRSVQSIKTEMHISCLIQHKDLQSSACKHVQLELKAASNI